MQTMTQAEARAWAEAMKKVLADAFDHAATKCATKEHAANMIVHALTAAGYRIVKIED
jgi:hypothetical protein